jgi:hypothetical protein
MRSALRSGGAPGGKPPQRQRRRDRQRRVAWLAAARGAGLGLPRRNRCFREPDGQSPELAQGDVISRPILHSVPLLWDVMTAILVRFEWHGDSPGSGTGPTSCTLHSSPPNDRSVQQGPLNRLRFIRPSPLRWSDHPNLEEFPGLRVSKHVIGQCPCAAQGVGNSTAGIEFRAARNFGADHDQPPAALFSDDVK